MQKLHITQRHTFYEIMECQYSVELENNFVWLWKQRNCKNKQLHKFLSEYIEKTKRFWI